MPDLVLGDLTQDVDIIEKARELAIKNAGTPTPKLEAGWASRLKIELRRRSDAVGFRQII